MKLSTLTALLILTIIGCSDEPLNTEYRYEVSGTSDNYFVTMQNTDNNTQQFSEVGNGWYYSWTQSEERWLYISAQNNNSSGNVTVKILKAGKVVAQNIGTGGYTIATVSGDY